jgi:hypothetical protein
MLEGHIAHEDFAGHAGTIGPGDVQWMTAGKVRFHDLNLCVKGNRACGNTKRCVPRSSTVAEPSGAFEND